MEEKHIQTCIHSLFPKKRIKLFAPLYLTEITIPSPDITCHRLKIRFSKLVHGFGNNSDLDTDACCFFLCSSEILHFLLCDVMVDDLPLANTFIQKTKLLPSNAALGLEV